MKTLEIADYEPASDGGNMRFYPKGRFIKKLIEDYVTRRVVDYGGLEVEDVDASRNRLFLEVLAGQAVQQEHAVITLEGV